MHENTFTLKINTGKAKLNYYFLFIYFHKAAIPSTSRIVIRIYVVQAKNIIPPAPPPNPPIML